MKYLGALQHAQLNTDSEGNASIVVTIRMHPSNPDLMEILRAAANHENATLEIRE